MRRRTHPRECASFERVAIRRPRANVGAICGPLAASRIPAMEFLLLCIVSVLFVFTVGGFFAGRGGD